MYPVPYNLSKQNKYYTKIETIKYLYIYKNRSATSSTVSLPSNDGLRNAVVPLQIREGTFDLPFENCNLGLCTVNINYTFYDYLQINDYLESVN